MIEETFYKTRNILREYDPRYISEFNTTLNKYKDIKKSFVPDNLAGAIIYLTMYSIKPISKKNILRFMKMSGFKPDFSEVSRNIEYLRRYNAETMQ